MKASEFGCGAAHQLAITAAKAAWEIEDFSKLTGSRKLCEEVLSCLRGVARIVPIEGMIDCDANPSHCGFAPLPKNQQPPFRSRGIRKWDSEKTSLTCVSLGGRKIKGEEWREFIFKSHVFPATVLDHLYKSEHQHLIPDDWKNVSAVVFGGTIYGGCNGVPIVRGLKWSSDRWQEVLVELNESRIWPEDYWILVEPQEFRN
ncbi:MAG: hypothetical protein V4481_04080 [Patescibacteria group bacterium]